MFEKLLTILAKIRWEWFVKLYKKPSYLTETDKLAIKRKLKDGYYIIATFQPYTLSGLFVVFMTWFYTGKIPKYTHVLMNVEPEGTEVTQGFRFVEATSDGFHYSDFDKALGKAKRVALLNPKYYTQSEWDDTVSEVYKHIGKKYDFGFDLKDNQKLTCVEAVWLRIKKMPFAEDNFRCLNMLVEMEGTLTPEMFLCPDFKVVLRVGKKA